MSEEKNIAKDQDFKKILSEAAEAIRSAGDYLRLAGDATYVDDAARQFVTERKSLDIFLVHLNEALQMTDHDILLSAAAGLKERALMLRGIREQIKQLDSAAAGEVAGYSEQAVTYIQQAQTLIAELP
ncbi:MAG TPA: hypothetical protein VGJ94_01285 [Syntrophorhabdaceae bacterium]